MTFLVPTVKDAQIVSGGIEPEASCDLVAMLLQLLPQTVPPALMVKVCLGSKQLLFNLRFAGGRCQHNDAVRQNRRIFLCQRPYRFGQNRRGHACDGEQDDLGTQPDRISQFVRGWFFA
jgi:hypothetical protein